jgi:putative oxidoreductase
VPTEVGLIGVAALESVIGVLLLSGRSMRLALGLLGIELIGILSPIVLLPTEMFRGPPARRSRASTCSRT